MSAAAVLADIDWHVEQQVFFYLIATTQVVAAWRVVTTKNIVHAALYLVVVLAGVAAQFILLGAEFIASTQVLVYIGAVIVLFLFGIMLTQARIGAENDLDQPNRLPAVLTAGLLAILTVSTVIRTFEDVELPDNSRTTTASVSDSIFSDYIIAFEAVSVLLLAALIGAIVVARKD
ncbi:MAG: NADH-quinone oxidoreductase subunit J [Acidimicrobiia bacterium]|nr:NADH-quinone oxidoreductase subunit J [Acidimicrobiia bacterium]